MADHLDPLAPEFATPEEADSYHRWFLAKVQASLLQADDPAAPRHTPDEVKRRMDAVIRAAELKHAQYRLA